MKLVLTIFLSFIAVGSLTISNAQKKRGRVRIQLSKKSKPPLNLEKLLKKKLLKKLQALKSEEDRLLMKLWVKDSRQQLRREK